MSFVPFTHDIFISYAHIDDRPLDDVKGWVTSLHERLKDRLTMLLGTEVRIWWDQRQQGNQYLAGMIGDNISKTLLMVSIVTPRYVNSAWCRSEIREFCVRTDRPEASSLETSLGSSRSSRRRFGPSNSLKSWEVC